MRKIEEQIKINNDDVFANDCLNREPEVKNISEVIKNLESSTVFTIDSDWGTGKTTFVRLLNAHLKKESEIQTCMINAWENDFETDPFIIITNEIISKLKPSTDDIQYLKEASKSLLKTIIPKATTYIPMAFGDPPIVGGKLKDVADDTLNFLTDQLFESLENSKQKKSAVEQFSESLKKIKGDQKLVIFIDELDRCRPTFAIETLERIKHLFHIEGLIFILSTNINQLSHGISGFYGQNFDGRKYLERFIDFSYQLKEPNQAMYWKALTNAEKQNNKLLPLVEHGQYLASKFLPTLREMNKLFFRLKLILLTDISQLNKPLLLLMLFIQNNSSGNYEKFCGYDKEIVGLLNNVLDFDILNIPVNEGGVPINEESFENAILDLWSILISKQQKIENDYNPKNGEGHFQQNLANLNGHRDLALEPIVPNPFEYTKLKEYKEAISLFAEFYTDLGTANAHIGEYTSAHFSS